MSLFDKLFMSSDWHIAIRKCQWQWPLNYDVPFHEFKGKQGYWYADPMLLFYDNKYYLFCEAFNNKKQIGEIAVSLFDGNQWQEPRVIISNNYHMSYPCVFRVAGSFYMIPESQEANRLEMYKAEEFPYKWRKINNLLENTRIADPTVWEYDGKMYLAGYTEKNPYKLNFYQLDVLNKAIKYFFTVNYEKNIGRPAGYLIKQSDSYLRPVQDCQQLYGRSILWNELRITEDNITEVIVGATDNSRIKIGYIEGVDRIHTFSRAGEFEVIDYCINHFDLFKRFKILWRQYKKKERGRHRIK